MSLPDRAALEHAMTLIRPYLPPTPQYSWPLLNADLGLEIWVKHENHTRVGAFKVRGGLVLMDWLRRQHPEVRGVITATKGNHGQSISFAAGKYGIAATIVVPEGNDPARNAGVRALGGTLVEHGEDFQASVDHARMLAERDGLFLVPSFHERLVAGVGTYSVEFLTAHQDLDVVYVPIGLGSGICGMVAAREALGLKTGIVGVVSDRAPAYALSVAQGEPVSAPVSTRIADGMACRTPVPEALEIIRATVDRIVQVSDDAVEQAMRTYFDTTHNVAEGAGAAGLAAIARERESLAGLKVGTVLCGGNVDRGTFARVLAAG